MIEVNISNPILEVAVQTNSGPVTISLVQSLPIVQVSSIGIQGPQGIPGAISSGSVIASEILGGHRAITVDGFHCEPSSASKLAGVSIGSAMLGTSVNYVSQGMVEEGSWTWITGLPIYLGALGVLTQIEPSSGVLRVIAWAVTSTKINVDFSEIVNLA